MPYRYPNLDYRFTYIRKAAQRTRDHYTTLNDEYLVSGIQVRQASVDTARFHWNLECT
jgi:hypothetical protein